MKKLFVLIVIGVLIYAGYEYFAKGVNIFENLLGKKETAVKTQKEANKEPLETKNTGNNIVFELEIGKHVTVKSANLPAGDIKLLSIDENKQSCLFMLYKSTGTATKGMDVRKIINNKWTLEVKLLSLKPSGATFSMAVVSDPTDRLMIVNSADETTSKNQEFVITLDMNAPVNVKSKNLSYGTLALYDIKHSKNFCSIAVYQVKGNLTMNTDFNRRIRNVTVRARLILLKQKSATISFSIPSDPYDKFERVKEK